MPTSHPELGVAETWVVVDGAFATDGGSIYLAVRNAAGAAHKLVLWQHLFKEADDPSRLPGRLYLDGSLVAVRSEQEGRLLAALRGASIAPPGAAREASSGALASSPGVIVGRDIQEYHAAIGQGPVAALAHLARQLIEYVESGAYVELAASQAR